MSEENQIIVDAEMRRRERAAKLPKPEIASKPSDTLEGALDRLSRLKIAPVAVSGAVEAERAGKTAELFTASNVPKRHAEKALKTLPDSHPWAAAMAMLHAKAGTGYMVGICGEQDRGKTQMGVELIRHASGQLRRCRFANAMDFFLALRGTYRPESKRAEADVIADFTKPALLVIDEIEERSDSAWESQMLFYMVNKRYNDMKDTVIMGRETNAAKFESSLGKSIARRMHETGGIIECNWESFRV